MYEISKEFHFSAAHQLHGLPQEHPCSRVHGHNYVVRIFLRGSELNEHDFLMDYRELDPIKNWIDSTLDHRNLNDVLPCKTTAENMAKYLLEVFKDRLVGFLPPNVHVYAVEVEETPKTRARFTI